MKILTIATVFPYPPHDGTLIQIYNRVRCLSRRHEVTLLCIVNERPIREHVDEIERYCECVFVFGRPIRTSKGEVSRALNFLRSVLRGIPYYEAARFSAEADAWVRQQAAQHVFDVVEADDTAGRYLKAAQPALTSLILHSVEDSNYRREMQYTSGVLKRLRLYGYWFIDRRNQLALSGAVDLCVTLTPENEADMRRLIPDLQVSNCLSNGVDLGYFSYVPPAHNATGVCFVGKLDYSPNEDAVLSFYREIYPLVRQVHPTARFFVVGSSPSERIQALSRDPLVEVTGFVEDVRPFLRRAGIAVVPIRMGGGILNKVLEAMAMGVPVITGPMGTHGLVAKPGRDLLVCDTAEDYAQEINRLLGDRDALLALAENGRRYVETYHEWCAIVTRYERELEARLAMRSCVKSSPTILQ